MRFGTDPDQVVQVTWSFCQPGALPLGLPTCFVSRDHEAHEIWPEIGEVQFAPRMNLPMTTVCLEPGTNPPCGDPEVWLNGYPGHVPPDYPLDAYSSSMCCADPIEVPIGVLGYWPSPEPDGGLAVGGIAETIGLADGEGGIAVGGEADFFGECEPVGGLAIGGEADAVQALLPVAGVAFGGEPELAGLLEAKGGLAIGGEADAVEVLAAEGGIALGGESDSVGTLSTAGGVALGGQSDTFGIIEARGGPAFGGKPNLIRSLEAAGGVALGGIRDQLRMIKAAGGLAWGGVADRVGVLKSTGGLAFGGASNPPFPLRPLQPQGGLAIGGNADVASWIAPFHITDGGHEQGSAITSVTTPGPGNGVSGLTIIWVTCRNTGGGLTANLASVGNGFSVAVVYPQTNDIGCALVWRATTGSSNIVVPFTWNNSSTITNAEYGFVVLGGASSPTLDSANWVHHVGTPISVTIPSPLASKTEIAVVAGFGNNTEYNNGPWSGMNLAIGVGTGFAGFACGSYLIVTNGLGFTTSNTTLFSGDNGALWATFRI